MSDDEGDFTTGDLSELPEQLAQAMAEYPDPVVRSWMAEVNETFPGECLRTLYIGGGFEGAHDGCADRDDPSGPCLCPADCRCCVLGDDVRLIERQLCIEACFSGGRDAGGVGEGCQLDATALPRRQRPPVERESC